MRRTTLAVAMAALLVLSGCAATRTGGIADRDGGVGGETPAGASVAGEGADRRAPAVPGADGFGRGPDPPVGGPDGPSTDGRVEAEPRPDPASDVQGWEDGYWHDDPVPVDAADGVNDTELSAVVARGMARVELVREVEFERTVEVSVVSREQYRERTTGGGGGGGGDGGPSPAATLRRVSLEATFLLAPDRDAEETESRNRAQTVGGYYDARSDRVVLVSDTAAPTVDEVTLAQELFHAYQWRHLLPDRVPVPNPSADTTTAWRAVIEGDANLVDARYERRCGTEWRCLRDPGASGDGNGSDGDAGNGGDGDGGNDGESGEVQLGLYLLQYFPYAAGERYVRAAYAESGWEGVDALYGNLPLSTEQVIEGADGEAVRERPPRVRVGDRSGPGWRRVVTREAAGRTVGAAGVASMFGYTLYDDREGAVVAPERFLDRNASVVLDYSLPVAEGWAGDRLYAYRSADGRRTAYVWRLRWEDRAAADRFLQRYRSLLEYRGAARVPGRDGVWRIDSGPFADAFRIDRQGRTVTVVSAPTVRALSAVHPAPDGARSVDSGAAGGVAVDPGTGDADVADG